MMASQVSSSIHSRTNLSYYRSLRTNTSRKTSGKETMLEHLLQFSERVFSRSGRWRSEYLIDLNLNRVKGRILVNVHYYEQGNVCSIGSLTCMHMTITYSGPIGDVAQLFSRNSSDNLRYDPNPTDRRDHPSTHRRRRGQVSSVSEQLVRRHVREDVQKLTEGTPDDTAEVGLGQSESYCLQLLHQQLNI